MDLFDINDLDDPDETPYREPDWWNQSTIPLYLDARVEDLEFLISVQDHQNTDDYYTQSVSTMRPTLAPAIRKVQERLFVVPKPGIEKSLFGIELPKPPTNPAPGLEEAVTRPPPESLYGYFEPSVTVSSETSNDLESRDCPELVANFKPIAAGLYNLLLRVKADGPTSVHLNMRVKIKYEAEYGHCDTVYSRFSKDSTVTEQGWHYLVAENQIEVRPHKENAWVNIRIMRNEKSDHPFVGKLWTRSVELVPFGHDPIDKDAKCLSTRVTVPDCILTTNRVAEKGVIIRLAHSKCGNYLAALRLLTDTIVVHVWPKPDLISKDVSEKDVSSLGASFTIDWRTATKTQPGENASIYDISLGLAISATGDQIAVYQMPRIGDWQDGMEVPTARLGFHLFRNPLADKETSVSVPGEPQMMSENGPVQPDQSMLTRLETSITLKNAVGYATYVGQYEDDSGKLSPAKFIFCNGLYLDVYEVNSYGLIPSHTISLEGLTPTISRRFACEMTMDSICENIFLWVEDGGRYCSTWDLSNGSAITRLDTSRWRYDNINSETMSFACSQNIMAIVGFDNSIATFYADSGIEISRRRFMNRRVKYIGFASNQSTELFVVIRERSEEDFSSITLDPFQLDIEFSAPTITIPTYSTIFCHLGQRLWTGKEIGVVCQPDVSNINLYPIEEPSTDDGQVGQRRVSLLMPRCITTSNNVHYEITISSVSVEDTPIGGVEPSERLVEIWKISENPPTESTERTLVFSFVPEPWEQRAPSHGFFLPTGDRFVVYATRTIQVWGLPVDKEPCKLLYFWSMFQPRPTVQRNKTEMELVLIDHKRLINIFFHEYSSTAGKTRVRANVVPQEKRGIRAEIRQVHIPNWPIRRVDRRKTTEDCFQSIRLLALAYTIVSSGYDVTQDVGLRNSNHEVHASAILNFVNHHINHTIYSEQLPMQTFRGNFWQPPTENSVTLWTYFLAERHLPVLCTKLITDLLNMDDCAWIPRKNEPMSPILAIIERKNLAFTEAFIYFCVRRTIECNPAYMFPVVQSFQILSLLYPDIISNILEMLSYVPAQSLDLNKSHVTFSDFDWRKFFGRSKSRKLKEYAFSVFIRHLTVLPPSVSRNSIIKTYPKPGSFVLTPIAADLARSMSETAKVSVAMTTIDDQNVEVPHDTKIFVAPFPRLSMCGIDVNTGRSMGQSQFSCLAGRDFFDNPAMMAVLRFKWWMYGFWYWLIRFMFLVFFYGIFVAVTIQQIESSVNLNTEGRTPSDVLKGRYMDPYPWRGLIAFDLFLGAVVLVLELLQLRVEGFWPYLTSIFNWVDAVSIVLTMTCQTWVLMNCVMTTEERKEEGPDRIPLVWLAIIAMYLHLLFELRVYQPLGIIVNIIIRIMRRIAWFFIIFAIMIIGFTHALVHILYTSKPECEPDENGKVPDKIVDCKTKLKAETEYPDQFFQGISGTLFFLAGRYDFVGNNFGSNDYAFHLTMIIFYFFTGLVLLNVLIALMNDAYNQCGQEGQLAWLKQWSKILDEVETIFLRHFQAKRLRHLLPDYIYYAAPIKVAEAYRAQLTVSEEATLSSETRLACETDARQDGDMKKKIDILEEQQRRQTAMLEALLDYPPGRRKRRGSCSLF